MSQSNGTGLEAAAEAFIQAHTAIEQAPLGALGVEVTVADSKRV